MTAHEILALPNDILATLAATGITALITIIQIIALWRATINHNLPVPETSKALPQKNFSFAVLFQIIFGIAIFAGLGWWAFHLFTIGLPKWAGLSGFFALVGIIMPIIVWCAFKKRTKTIESLFHTRKPPEKPLPAAQQPSTTDAEPLIVKRTDPEPETSAEPVFKTEPLVETAMVAKPFAGAEVQPEITNPNIPQDSALRRHYLTHIHYLIESRLPIRPTDSALKRHYEHLLATELDKYLHGQPAQSAAITPIVKTETSQAVRPKTEMKQRIPQDSVLKRHFLTHLRFQIESALPARPTDSVLRRHYYQLVDAELEKRLEQISS